MSLCNVRIFANETTSCSFKFEHHTKGISFSFTCQFQLCPMKVIINSGRPRSSGETAEQKSFRRSGTGSVGGQFPSQENNPKWVMDEFQGIVADVWANLGIRKNHAWQSSAQRIRLAPADPNSVCFNYHAGREYQLLAELFLLRDPVRADRPRISSFIHDRNLTCLEREGRNRLLFPVSLTYSYPKRWYTYLIVCHTDAPLGLSCHRKNTTRKTSSVRCICFLIIRRKMMIYFKPVIYIV